MTNESDIENKIDSLILEAKVDGISKGLRMGMAAVYAELLSFDRQNIENDKPSFALTFLEQQASELGQTIDDFMDEQTGFVKEYYEYHDTIDKIYEVSDKYGYKEEK
jgi:hypothetical protein